MSQRTFDPRLLGGEITTQQQLLDNPEILNTRQAALDSGFAGGTAWGDGRFEQFKQGQQGSGTVSVDPANAPRPGLSFDFPDFSDLSPGEQATGKRIGYAGSLQNYLFPKDADGNPLPYQNRAPDSYVPTLDDAPIFNKALDAANEGLGAYDSYFQEGRDVLNEGKAYFDEAATMIGNAPAAAEEGLSLAKEGILASREAGRRAESSATAAAADARAAGSRAEGSATSAENLANAFAMDAYGNIGGDISRGTSAAQGAMTREEQLTAAAVTNAQATQERMSALSGPGGGAAFMDPYQDAVINDNLRRLNEQGRSAQNQANAEAVQSGAFGGSRQGVRSAQLAERLQDAKSRYLNQAQSTNFLQAQRAAQSAATSAQGGGGLVQTALGTGSGRALEGGNLGVSEAGQAGSLNLNTGQAGANTAIAGGNLASGVQNTVAGNEIRAGQVGSGAAQQVSNTILNAGQGLGAVGQGMTAVGGGIADIGVAGTKTSIAEDQNAAKLGLIPLDILEAQAKAQQGNYAADKYQPVRDLSTITDILQGIPSTQSVGAVQATTGNVNPFGAALAGGITGLQAGQVLNR